MTVGIVGRGSFGLPLAVALGKARCRVGEDVLSTSRRELGPPELVHVASRPEHPAAQIAEVAA